MTRFIILAALLLVPFVSMASEVGTPSKEARDHLREAIRIVREARSPSDYVKAEGEFEEALRHAPTWGDAHAGLASLAEAMGKHTKAIRGYERYLELTPAAADRQDILAQIEKLRRVKESRNRLGMAWVTLVSLDDGIYIANVSPGSRIEKAGFRKGDRIKMINRRELGGKGLEEFYRLLETPHETADMEARVLNYARKQGVENAVSVTVVRGGTDLVIVCNMDIFRSAVRAVEEDDLDEVLRGGKPVLLSLWAHWCPPCREFIQTLEELAERYRGRIEFVTIDADSNKQAMKRLGTVGIPATFLFVGGKERWHLEGKKEIGEMEELLKKEGVTPTKEAAGERNPGMEMGRPLSKEQSDAMRKLAEAVLGGKGGTEKAAGGGARGWSRGEAAPSPAGVCINEVLPGSAAEKGGVRKGDKIVSLDGEKFSDMAKFAAKIGMLPEGSHQLVVSREGNETEVEIELPPQMTRSRLGVQLIACDALKGL